MYKPDPRYQTPVNNGQMAYSNNQPNANPQQYYVDPAKSSEPWAPRTNQNQYNPSNINPVVQNQYHSQLNNQSPLYANRPPIQQQQNNHPSIQPQYSRNTQGYNAYQPSVNRNIGFTQYPYSGNGYQTNNSNPPTDQSQRTGFSNQPLGYTRTQYNPMPPQQYQQQPQYSSQNQYNKNSQVPNPYPTGYGKAPASPVSRPPVSLEAVVKVLMYVFLPVLFIASMVLSSMPILKWVFLGGALITLILSWIIRTSNPNMRLTMTIVYVALIIVAAASALNGNSDNTNVGNPNVGVTPPSTLTSSYNGGAGSGNSNGSDTIGALVQISSAPAVTPQPALNQIEAVARLESFFYFWSVNNFDQMVEFCAPSWRAGLQSPKASLFRTLSGRTPTSYETEKISGTQNDTSRTVTVKAKVERNGRTPATYRLNILMVKESEAWYVDPNSLTSLEATQDEATVTPEVTATPEPTKVPGSTALYYNPKGGSKYHLDQNCISVGKAYLPLKGKFTYSEVNDKDYAELSACNVCNAPLRDQ